MYHYNVLIKLYPKDPNFYNQKGIKILIFTIGDILYDK